MDRATYAKRVKHKLIDIGKTQAWLIEEVKKKTGLYCDQSYMSKIYNGVERGEKIVAAINEILELTEEREDTA